MSYTGRFLQLRFALPVLFASVIFSTAGVSSAHADFPHRTAEARPKTFSGGVIFGEPTGLTGKYWLSRTDAIDGGFAYSFNSYAIFYSDYLVHFPKAFQGSELSKARLTPYFGVGALLGFGGNGGKIKDTSKSTAGLGLRIPLGVEWMPAGVPLGVFAELAPGMWLLPGISGYLQGGVGVRFYFL